MKITKIVNLRRPDTSFLVFRSSKGSLIALLCSKKNYLFTECDKGRFFDTSGWGLSKHFETHECFLCALSATAHRIICWVRVGAWGWGCLGLDVIFLMYADMGG